MGTALRRLTAAGHGRPRCRGSGPGGRGLWEERPRPAQLPLPARASGSCGTRSSPCCRRRGGVWLLFPAQRPHPQKTGTNPQSHKNQRLLNEIEQLHSPPPPTHTTCGPCSRGRQRADIPPIGRTRSLKCSGTASCCFPARAETDKDIVKEKFDVAYYKTESLKNLRTFGSISYLVNRTHIYSCVF